MGTKILLAEDHAIVRQGLYSLIEKQPDIEVIGEAADGLKAVQMSLELKPDIVLMDVSLPVLNGIQATQRIKEQDNSIKVLALSVHDDAEFVMGMVDAGVSGYLLKDCILDELVKAIRCVMKGESYLCPKIAAIVLESKTGGQSILQSEKLPLREHEIKVLKLLADGNTAKEIAFLLESSVKTIEGNRRQIMNKLEIDNFADLVKYAINKGLSSLKAEAL